MRVAEPLASPCNAAWKAELRLDFRRDGGRTLLAEKRADGPLVVQKALYPEGEAVCHAIVVHPPGGIAGGDELVLRVAAREAGHALLTTPGAAKWYRSAGPLARQRLDFEVGGSLEWLPRESIVFDGALAELHCAVQLRGEARFIGWEVLCLGRAGSGEQFDRGRLGLQTAVSRDGALLWLERGAIEGGGALMRSPAGLGGRAVFGTMIAACGAVSKDVVSKCRAETNEATTLTQLPGVLIARYLGDSSEQAMQAFTRLWQILRPALIGRDAIVPRIWST